MDANFKIQFDAKVNETLNQVNAIFALGVDEMFNKIIQETPVDTGFARASWWKSINEIGTHPSPPVAVKKGEKVAQAPQIGMQLSKITIKDKVYLATNCVYMRRLEFDGHSKQKPSGWIRTVVADAPKYFKVARTLVKSKGIK